MTESQRDHWLTVDETCLRLNVKRQTVYSYISRGRLTSRKSPSGRGSEVLEPDVEYLASLVAWRRSGTVDQIESAITLIRDERPYYRGRDVISELIDRSSLEDVAGVMWAHDLPDVWLPNQSAVDKCRLAQSLVGSGCGLMDNLRIAVSTAAAVMRVDDAADPKSVAEVSPTFLATVVAALPSQHPLPEQTTPGIAQLLLSKITSEPPCPEVVRLLDTALILLADHDLPESTRVVRMAARAGVGIGAVCRVGLDVSGGPVKSAATVGLPGLLRGGPPDRPGSYMPREGEPIPGFGHTTYPHGDPRARALLERLTALRPDAMSSINAALARRPLSALPAPNIGFALAALAHVQRWPSGAAELVFTLARTVGWIAHALEEYSARHPRGVHHSIYHVTQREHS